MSSPADLSGFKEHRCVRASEQFRKLITGKPPWQVQVLAPVLLVVGFWIVMSIGTTIYLRWVETSYDRVFSENLTSISAAHSLELIGWKILASWDDAYLDTARFQAQLESCQSELENLGHEASLSARTPQEKETAEDLRLAVEQIGNAINTELSISLTTEERSKASGQKIRELAEKLSTNAVRLRKINDELIAVARSRLAETHSLVLVTRMLMLLLGPLIGIYLGWRVARRLQSSVTEIAVTLNESASADETQGLRVSITKESSIEDVRRQAERVVERLRSVGLELQSARREVIQSERLAAVGELAAGVAHELRNPLTSVKLLLQHVSKRANGFRIEAPQLQLILEEVGRMEGTIQGLLDFSRTPTLNRVQHDLRDTLRRSINLVEGRLKQERIELLMTISSTPLMMNGDAEQLNQVFVNLFLNSIEAMPGVGQMTIVAEPCGDGNVARVVVKDNGEGIASEVLTRLFEPFATTKERGTGLGLAISRRIVTEHNGTISAENLPGCGAMFIVELPLGPRSEVQGKS